MGQSGQHHRCAVLGHASAARTGVYVYAMMASAKSAQKFGATIKRRIPAPTIVAAILSVIILKSSLITWKRVVLARFRITSRHRKSGFTMALACQAVETVEKLNPPVLSRRVLGRSEFRDVHHRRVVRRLDRHHHWGVRHQGDRRHQHPGGDRALPLKDVRRGVRAFPPPGAVRAFLSPGAVLVSAGLLRGPICHDANRASPRGRPNQSRGARHNRTNRSLDHANRGRTNSSVVRRRRIALAQHPSRRPMA